MDSAENTLAAALDDRHLVTQCLAGSEEAWSLLIDKHKSLIYSIPIKCGLPAADAADVLQATCLELLARLPQLREPRAMPKWLIQVAHHQCWKWKHQQQKTLSRDSTPDLPEPEIPAIAEALVQQTHEEQTLREAMASLEAKCRRLIDLLFFQTPSRPYVEVAHELGLKVGTVGSAPQSALRSCETNYKAADSSDDDAAESATSKLLPPMTRLGA